MSFSDLYSPNFWYDPEVVIPPHVVESFKIYAVYVESIPNMPDGLFSIDFQTFLGVVQPSRGNIYWRIISKIGSDMHGSILMSLHTYSDQLS